jgi:hypothetical protein
VKNETSVQINWSPMPSIFNPLSCSALNLKVALNLCPEILYNQNLV